jgi:hypothetical protein
MATVSAYGGSSVQARPRSRYGCGPNVDFRLLCTVTVKSLAHNDPKWTTQCGYATRDHKFINMTPYDLEQ